MFLPLLFIGQRRWRMFGGAASGGLVLIAISFLAAGARWPLDYLATLTNPASNPAPALMVNLHGLFHGVSGGSVIELVSCLAVAAAVWLVMKKATFLEGLAIVLVGGLLTSYHTYTGDCVLLVPACSIIVSSMADHWTVLWAALAIFPLIMKRPVGVHDFGAQRVSLSIPRHKLIPALLYRFRNGNAV